MKKTVIFTFILSMVLLYTPVIGNFFKIINTLIHEVGHAFMTLLVNGEVRSISLFYNTEGVTVSGSKGGFDLILISLAGYFSTSLFVLFFSFLWKKEKHYLNAFILFVLSFISLVFWIRNLFGFIWIILFITFLFYIMKHKNKKWIASTSLILLIALFTQSFHSSLDILLLSFTTPYQAGDATNLSKYTYIPTQIWGSLFFLQSLVFSIFTLFMVFKKN